MHPCKAFTEAITVLIVGRFHAAILTGGAFGRLDT